MRAVHVIVRGRVQGVGFREWTRRMAEQRNISGWVRNRSEGYVEAVVAGEDAAVDTMLALLKKGPPASFVTNIEVNAAELPTEKGFQRLPTV